MRRVLALLIASASLQVAAPAWCQDPGAVEKEEVEVFARVVVAQTSLRSGPGVGHRVVYRANRGDMFAIQGREGAGFWLRVMLEDGRIAYVLGDTVEPIAVGADEEGPRRPGFFAPPALEEARGGFAMVGGIFDGSGYAEIKPAIVLAPAIAIEPFAGLALTASGRRFVYGGGGTLNIGPDWPVAPYVHLGAGGVTAIRNEDDFAGDRKSTRLLARAGGGLLVSLRWRILLRVEAMNNVLFEPDSRVNVQTYAGGLGTYF